MWQITNTLESHSMSGTQQLTKSPEALSLSLSLSCLPALCFHTCRTTNISSSREEEEYTTSTIWERIRGRLCFKSSELDFSSKKEKRPVVIRRCRFTGAFCCCSTGNKVKRRWNHIIDGRFGGGVLVCSNSWLSVDSSSRVMAFTVASAADLRRA